MFPISASAAVAAAAAGGSQTFGVTSYVGDGNSTKSVLLGFQPDLVIIKRTDAAGAWYVVDDVRGITKVLQWEVRSAESTLATVVTAIGATTITVGSTVNSAGAEYMVLAFKEDADFFDIVSYTGSGTADVARNVGHSLNSAPDFIIGKNRDAGGTTDQHFVWHTDSPGNRTGVLNTGDTPLNADGNLPYDDGAHTDSIFKVKDDTGGDAWSLNTTAENYIAYLMTAVAEKAAFGTYTGNGAFNPIGVGFQPRIAIIKRASGAGYPYLLFNRGFTNNTRDYLITSGSDGVATYGTDLVAWQADDLAARTNLGFINRNGSPYVFAAFA